MSARGIGSSNNAKTYSHCARLAPEAQLRALRLERRLQLILNCNRQGQVYDKEQEICVTPRHSPDHIFSDLTSGDVLAFQNPDGTWGEGAKIGGSNGSSVTCVENPVATTPVIIPPVTSAPPTTPPPSTKPPACASDEGSSCCPFTACSSNGTVQCNGSCAGAVKKPTCSSSEGSACCPFTSCSSDGTVQCDGTCSGAVEAPAKTCKTITICPPVCVPGPNGECQSEEPGPCHSYEVCN